MGSPRSGSTRYCKLGSMIKINGYLMTSFSQSRQMIFWYLVEYIRLVLDFLWPSEDFRFREEMLYVKKTKIVNFLK